MVPRISNHIICHFLAYFAIIKNWRKMSDHDLSLTIDEDHLPKSIREQTEARELDTFIHEPLNP